MTAERIVGALEHGRTEWVAVAIAAALAVVPALAIAAAWRWPALRGDHSAHEYRAAISGSEWGRTRRVSA